MLDEMNREVAELRKIKTVQPNHWSSAIFTMIVVVPCGSQDDIATVHCNSLAMDGGEATITFNNQTHRECDVAMRGCGLVWHNKLEACIDRVSCIRCFYSIHVQVSTYS